MGGLFKGGQDSGMASKDSFSNVEDRFASIRLNLQGRSDGLEPQTLSPSKFKTKPDQRQYHTTRSFSNHGNFTTPCKAPVLSTARRAETKVKDQRETSPARVKEALPMHPVTPRNERWPSSTRRHLVTRRMGSFISEGSALSNAENTGRPTFSFMKDTTASLNRQIKTQTAMREKNYGIGSEESPSCQKSGASLNFFSNKPYNARSRNSAGKSQFATHHTVYPTQLQNSGPVHIAYSNYQVPTLSFQDMKFPSNERDTMEKKIGNKLHDFSKQLDSPTSNKVPRVLSFRENIAADVFCGKVNEQGMQEHVNEECLEEYHSKKGKNSRNKIGSLRDVFQLIYSEDPALFDGSVCGKNIKERMPLNKDKVIWPTDSNVSSLDMYQRGELLRKKNLYYLPDKNNQCTLAGEQTTRTININQPARNFGFDDERGNYLILPHDHIDYRYEIDDVLGNGSFGNVLKCTDHKCVDLDRERGATVAVKMIKNDVNWSLQALCEIRFLKHLKEKKPQCNDYILQYKDHFHFRGHMCIVTEMLSLNLFSLLEITNLRGLSLNVIRIFAEKILKGLNFIHQELLIHCDIKPENIMVKLPHIPNANSLESLDSNSIHVKIIDFGSACFEGETTYSYIQSRFYRAPEVIIGASYDRMIDIWSFGCVIAELYLGVPLLPGQNEIEQVGLILELFGAPKSLTILRFRRAMKKGVNKNSSTRKIIEDIERSRPFQLRKIAGPKFYKRSLLYRLFDVDGKLDLNFVKMKLQSDCPNPAFGSSRKMYRPNSKTLDVALCLNTSQEDKSEIAAFVGFLTSIFKWDPSLRASTETLLYSNFVSGRTR